MEWYSVFAFIWACQQELLKLSLFLKKNNWRYWSILKIKWFIFCFFRLKYYFCNTKMKPHLQNRETHQIIRNTENSFIFQWRATPSGSIYAGGLQRGRALKSCLSEFRHASGAAFLFLEWARVLFLRNIKLRFFFWLFILLIALIFCFISVQ